MKRIIIFAIFIITLVTTPSMVFAQPMMGTQSAVSSDGHTAREEAEGKKIWEKLQAKQLECKNLTDDNYGSLGEYFMGQSIGDTQRHIAMNQMMISMMGEKGEAQMHVAMGKRMSGCNPDAPMPQNMMMGSAFAPESFGGTRGGGNPMMGTGWGNMMGWGFGILGWLFMIIFWVLIILGVVALIRYLGSSGRSSDKEKTPLEILKERYANGEINKKEFEEKKRDLS